MDAFLSKTEFSKLFSVLDGVGYRVLAPSIDQGVIRYQEVDSVDRLRGMRSEQSPGQYRLHATDNEDYFGWAVASEALKPLTFVPQEVLWQSSSAEGLNFAQHTPDDRPTAIIGARACDLAALALQKQHFMKPGFEDHWFSSRLSSLLIIAVECHTSADTCFCYSTGDGPAVEHGYDIRLHEVPDGYLVSAGSKTGEKVLSRLPTEQVTETLLEQRNSQLQLAEDQQSRKLPEGNLYSALIEKHKASAWQAIAERCLSCGNCTAVCPTCFCHNQHDEITPDPQSFAHVRQWDSCFNEQHSYIHGIVIRKDTQSRYRQWLTHKLGSWYEQYGRSGCVGCGRCITWCPVGIDITESVQQVLEDETC